MDVLFENDGRYQVVWDHCPGLKLYDTLLKRIAFGNASYYDNMRSDGKTALEYAVSACTRLNDEYKQKLQMEQLQRKSLDV